VETAGPGPKRPPARPTRATRGTTHLASSAATFNGDTSSQRRTAAVGQCRSPESQPRIIFGATQRLIAGPPGPERGTSGRAGERRGAARLRAALIP
jgi:hypothetical protein